MMNELALNAHFEHTILINDGKKNPKKKPPLVLDTRFKQFLMPYIPYLKSDSNLPKFFFALLASMIAL